MKPIKIQVYIKINKYNCIIDIDSSIFLTNISGYIRIDEGYGDKYSHAQGMYLDKQIRDDQGRCNYKYENGEVIALTEEEKEELYPPIISQPSEQQVLNAKLLQDNAEMSIELEKQKQLNAQILLQLAGGNTNV